MIWPTDAVMQECNLRPVTVSCYNYLWWFHFRNLVPNIECFLISVVWMDGWPPTLTSVTWLSDVVMGFKMHSCITAWCGPEVKTHIGPLLTIQSPIVLWSEHPSIERGGSWVQIPLGALSNLWWFHFLVQRHSNNKKYYLSNKKLNLKHILQ